MTELGPISDAVGGIGAVIKLGATNPQMRKAGSNLAYSLDVLTSVIKTALMPLAVVNARAQDFFATKFPELLAEKLVDVPVENLETPKPSVAGPVLQGLNYSHEEPPLRELYLGLLATAMDSRISSSAHPAFAEVIAALSAEEVPVLDVVVRQRQVTLARLRVETEGAEGWRVVRHNLGPWRQDGEQLVDPMLPAYIDNWARLGLIQIDYMTFTVGETAYEWVTERPEYKEEESRLGPGESLAFDKGIGAITEFGKAFARAVGILDLV